MVPADPADYIAPENKARIRIDGMLERAGWVVQDYKDVNLHAGEGVAVRELVTSAGPADYVLFVNRQAVGVIEAKKQGTPLAGVEWQTVKYQSSIPDELRPTSGDGHLPFGYESTGDDTWFTCRFDPSQQPGGLLVPSASALGDLVESDVDGQGGSLALRSRHRPLPSKSHPWLGMLSTRRSSTWAVAPEPASGAYPDGHRVG